jgi:hypothetical protein
LKDYWAKKETDEERWRRLTEEQKCWKQRYAPFAFHLASWDTKMVLALVRGSQRPVPGQWHKHGISHRYLALGVPFGEPRSAPPRALSIISHAGSLLSPLFVELFHPELLDHLEHYSSDALRSIAEDLVTSENTPSTPILLQSSPPIVRCIPQRTLQATVQIASMCVEPATTTRYNILCQTMHHLGARSILVDLRSAPITHKELARRQKLKRNTFTWPTDPAAQLLHPIGLRERFGMKYQQIGAIVHFASRPITYQSQDSYPDAAMEGQIQARVSKPEGRCTAIVDLVAQHHPLLLLDDHPRYETSLRRAIVIHLLSLFEHQVEIHEKSMPDE